MVEFVPKSVCIVVFLLTLIFWCPQAMDFSRRFNGEGTLQNTARSEAQSQYLKYLSGDSPSFGITTTDYLGFGRPSCVSWPGSKVYCFYRGQTPSMYRLTLDEHSIDRPRVFGGDLYKDIQCVTILANKIDCFYTNSENRAVFGTIRNGTWRWSIFTTNRMQSEIGRSSCVGLRDELSGCLFRTIEAHPNWCALEKGEIPHYQNFSYTYNSPISCVASAPNSVFCYGACDNNCLCYTHFRNGWVPNAAIQCPSLKISSEPTSVLYFGNLHHIFSTDLQKRMVHLKYQGGSSFTGYEIVGDKPLIESPECLGRASGEIYCFAVGYNSQLYKVYYNGVRWSEYKGLGADYLESPSCTWYNDLIIICLTRNVRGHLARIVIQT